ncbi:MAG TPA: TatD family hydrolase [Thermotogota bacterium]|nr:TatD family hydrolase [Thermotogota bacterium]
MWIDTHTHLWDKQFDHDRNEILTSIGKDIKYVIEIGVNCATSEQALSLAYQNDHVFAVIGVHPHDAKELNNEGFERIRELSKLDRVVGIGEIGLDFYKNYSTPKVQKACFVRFLRFANEVNLPIVLHIRDAYEEMIEILRIEGIPKAGGVVHSFLSNEHHARQFIDLNLYLGIGGPITFKKNQDLRDTIKKIPVENLIIETDCPYLTPVPKRGHRNEPAFVQYVAQEIAKIKKIPIIDLEEILCENAADLFALPKC